MTYVLDLRRADAVKPGDVILAQHDGILGPWRVTEQSWPTQPMQAPRGLSSIMLRLVSQGHPGGTEMLQMHLEGTLVPLLSPLENHLPEEPEEQTITLKLRLG